MLIFSPQEIKYIWYLPPKSTFSFYFILNGNTLSTNKVLSSSFLFDLTFAVCLLGITLDVNRFAYRNG